MSDDTRPIKTRLRDGVRYYKKYSNIEQLPKDLQDALTRIDELEASVAQYEKRMHQLAKENIDLRVELAQASRGER